MRINYQSKLTKILTSVFLITICSFTKTSAVSHLPQKKKILLEEFTGINCGNCPDGTIVAELIKEGMEDSAYVISIHSGHYADPIGTQPDFRYDYGDSIYNGESLGYPAGNINRKVFSGYTDYTITRSEWIKRAKQTFAEIAPINLEVTSTIDVITRKLTVKVNTFYTGASSTYPIYLNIGVTQSGIVGYQSGSTLGNNYIHDDALRDYITGYKGDSICIPQTNSSFEKTYTYDIPSNYKGIATRLEDLNVIAFVTGGPKKEIINVEGGKPLLLNYQAPTAALLTAVALPSLYGSTKFPVSVKNMGSDTIRNLQFDVTINGIKQVSTCNTQITPNSVSKKLEVSVLPYSIATSNSYQIKLTKINDINFDGQTISGTFSAPVTATNKIYFEFRTDNFGDENTLIVRDRDKNTVASYGPYTTGTVAIYKDSLTLPAGIYQIELKDKWGDGVNSPRGYFKLRDSNSALLAQQLQIVTFGYQTFINIPTGLSAINENNQQKGKCMIHQTSNEGLFAVHYFPSTNGPIKFTVLNLKGEVIQSISTNSNDGEVVNTEFNINNLGIYLLQIKENNRISSVKFIKK